MKPKLPEFGRFAEPSLLILVSLSDGPKHGCAMMGDIERGTGGRWVPARCTRRLLDSTSGGLLVPLTPVDRRRPYRLTTIGASMLAEQLRGLSAFAQQGLRKQGNTPQ